VPVTETVEIVPEAVQREPEVYERIGEERTFEIDLTPARRKLSAGGIRLA